MEYNYGTNLFDDIKTVELMKLFRENIKKDISNTSDVIQLAQEKMKNFDLNLNSLKNSTKELNVEFNEFTSKVDILDSAIRNFVLNMSSSGGSGGSKCNSISNSSSSSNRSSQRNSAHSADDYDSGLLDSYDETNNDDVFDFQSDGIDNQLMDILISNLKKSISSQ